jgi:nucleoside-diphosphate-sugar epimerase
MTILQFAEKIIELTDSKSKITFIEPTDMRIKDDPKVRQPDITKARQTLQWEPKVSLDDGLNAAIAYFRPLI